MEVDIVYEVHHWRWKVFQFKNSHDSGNEFILENTTHIIVVFLGAMKHKMVGDVGVGNSVDFGDVDLSLYGFGKYPRKETALVSDVYNILGSD